VNKLESVLSRAKAERWCCRWGCTTCGSAQFREAALRAVDAVDLERDSALRLGRALRDISPEAHPDASEFLLRWLGRELNEAEIQEILGETSHGSLYRRMLAARDQAKARRAEHERLNSPEYVAAQRAKKAAARAEKHRQRLAEKAKRDAKLRAEGKI